MKNIVIIGGGGHAKVLIDLIKTLKNYKLQGIIDPKIKKGEKIFGVKVLGNDKILLSLKRQGLKNLALGIGSDGNNQKRLKVWRDLKKKGFNFPALIHKNSYTSKNSVIGQGSQVFNHSVVNAGARIGEISVINTSTIIEHDCRIGNNVFTGTRATICGGVIVEDNTFIGAESCILPKVKVKNNVLIAAGALVNKNLRSKIKVKGIPAKKF